MNVHLTIPVLFLVVTLSGCAPSATKSTPVPDAATVIRVGMTEDAVLDRLGEPQLVDPYQVGKYIFFYPLTETADCINDRASCIPVVFEEGRVISVGRRGVSAPRRAPPPAPKPRPVDAETRREIERLERQVHQIPASKTMDNLRIYRYLLKLDPNNVKYQQKVARYEAQYRREEQDQREELRRERRYIEEW
jgi:hypothetical protein